MTKSKQRSQRVLDGGEGTTLEPTSCDFVTCCRMMSKWNSMEAWAMICPALPTAPAYYTAPGHRDSFELLACKKTKVIIEVIERVNGVGPACS